MTNLRRLIRLAIVNHWSQGNPVPVDLYIEMTNAGIEVDTEQDNYLKIYEDNKQLTIKET